MNSAFDRDGREIGQKLPAPSFRAVLFSALAAFLGITVLPLCTVEWFSLAALVLLFAYVVWILRLPSAVAVLLASTFGIVALTSSVALGAVFLGLIVGVGASAFLINLLPRPYLAVSVYLIAALAVLAYTGSAPLALLALATLPAAVLLAVFTKRNANRTSAILACEVGLLAVIAVAAAYWLMQRSRAYDVSVAVYVESLREEAVALLQAAKQTVLDALLQVQTANTQALTDTFAKIDDATLRALIDQLINLLPGVICIVCSIVAYEAQLFLAFAYRTVGHGDEIKPQARVFTMSIPAAVLFFVSFVLSLFSNGSLAFAVIDNLKLILFPGFFLLGIGALSQVLRRTAGGVRVALLLGGVALLCCSLSGAISLVALFGANRVILGSLEKRLYQKLVERGELDPEDLPDDQNDRDDQNDQDGNDGRD